MQLGLGMSLVSQALLSTGGGPDPGAGVKERTEITVTGNPSAALTGSYFLISNQFGRLAVWFRQTYPGQNCVMQATITNDGMSFATEGAAKYIGLRINGAMRQFWFNTGPELAPEVENPIEVSIEQEYTAGQIAVALNGIISTMWPGSSFVSGETIVQVTNPAQEETGAQDFTDGSITLNVSVEGFSPTQNEPHSVSEPFDDYLPVDIADGDTESQIAAKLGDALTNVALTVLDVTGATMLIQDNAVGEREDAASGDTGWTIDITQQGANPV